MATEGVTSRPTQAAASETVKPTVTAGSTKEMPGTASREPPLCEPKPVVRSPSTRVSKVGDPISPGVKEGMSSVPLSLSCAGTSKKTPSISVTRDVALSVNRGGASRRVSGQGAR